MRLYVEEGPFSWAGRKSPLTSKRRQQQQKKGHYSGKLGEFSYANTQGAMRNDQRRTGNKVTVCIPGNIYPMQTHRATYTTRRTTGNQFENIMKREDEIK